MAIFTLTITARTGKAGETAVQERLFVVEMLRRAAQQIGDGTKPLSGQNVAEPGVAGQPAEYTAAATRRAGVN